MKKINDLRTVEGGRLDFTGLFQAEVHHFSEVFWDLMGNSGVTVKTVDFGKKAFDYTLNINGFKFNLGNVNTTTTSYTKPTYPCKPYTKH